MLTSPLAILSEYRWTTAGVILALATALWLVAALGVASVQTQAATDAWWDGFVPVVYVDGGADSAQVERLKTEIEEWSLVDSVEIDRPQDAMARLEEQLGADEVRAMGVSETMMPTGLVVRPAIWRAGEVDVIARLEALEMRPAVVGVDAPQAGALRWIASGRKVVVGFGLVVLIGLIGALMGMSVFLRRVQERERRANHLLEVFGASASSLKRPTMWRGATLGTAAGIVAGIAFLPWSLILDTFVGEMVGVGAFPALRSALLASGLIGIGLVLGLVVGVVCGRARRSRGDDGMESLLDWKREET